jgi:hypothetical protein
MGRVPVLIVAAGGAGVVAQQGILGQPLQGVDAEAVHPAVQPKAQHLVHGCLDRGVIPVQVGLLTGERVQVPLAGPLLEGPGGADRREVRAPVVGRATIPPGAPHIPVTLGIGAARS